MMLLQTDRPSVSVATGRDRAPPSSLLAWTLGLGAALGLPVLLPVSGSPPALAAFLGLVGVMILFTRHWLIAVLPVLAVLGPYFLPLQAAGINVFGFRLLIMLLALFSTPLTSRAGWWFNPVARRATLFILFWMIWGILSLLWAPDLPGALSDIVTLVFALGLLLTLLSLNAYKAEHLDKLRVGWILALAAAAVAAILEIVRGYGLPSDLQVETVHTGIALGYAGLDAAVRSTLGFSNQFGGFLLLTVPFVLWSMERARGTIKLIHAGGLLAIGVLILYSASRLSLIGLAVQLLIYSLVLQRRWYMPFVVLAISLVVIFAAAHLIENSKLQVSEKLASFESGGDRSMHHRLALTLNGLWMVYKTAGRGAGAGAFTKEITGDVPFELPIQTLSEWNAHNLWIEVLSEYGVLVLAAFLALLVWIGILGWRAHQWNDGLSSVGRAIIVGLIGYLFCGVTSGSIISKSTHWMYLVSLVLMAACLHEAYRARHRAGAPALIVPSLPASNPRE